MFSIILLTVRGILKSLICVVHFCNNFMVYSTKKIHETYWCSSSIAYQDETIDWLLRISTKNPLYPPIVSTLHFFEGHNDQGETQLVIKPFGITRSAKTVSLS